MTARTTDPSAERGTKRTLRQVRADVLHRLLLSPRGQVVTLEDIARLPTVGRWAPWALDIAVADLVADGRLTDDEYGRPHAVTVNASC